VVDFGNLRPHSKVTFTNSAPTPYKSGAPPARRRRSLSCSFRVKGQPRAHPVVSPFPGPFEPLRVSDVTVRRRVTLTEKENEASGEPESSHRGPEVDRPSNSENQARGHGSVVHHQSDR